MNEQKMLLYAALRSELRLFIQKSFETVSPADKFLPNWHIDAIAYQLTRIVSGEIKHLIITMPPRSGKSISVSVAFVAWLLGHQPAVRVVCASYGNELATQLSMDTRKVMESDWYAECFPGTKVGDDKNTQDFIGTTKSGYRRTTTVGGAFTGLGGDYIIIDDPIKADDAPSESKRKSVLDWFANTVLSRQNQPTEGRFIVIQQRTHEEDLAGHLLDAGGWTHLNLPVIAEVPEDVAVGAGKMHHREPGDLLHPERMPKAYLDILLSAMGTGAFNAQYQQKPGPAGEQIIKWPWFLRFHLKGEGHLIGFNKRPGDVVLQSYDQAYTNSSRSDYTVCTTYLYRDGLLYLLNVLREKYGYTDLLRKIPEWAAAWKADQVIVEGTGAGLALASTLQRLDPMKYLYSTPKDDKVTRLRKFSPLVERGLVLLPYEALWLQAFKNEIESFPNGKHDDQVDSFSQALKWLYREDNWRKLAA
jgi:predicted phage terminase large subunit-like protein